MRNSTAAHCLLLLLLLAITTTVQKLKLFDNFSWHSGTKLQFLGPLCAKLKLFDNFSRHSGTKLHFLGPLCEKLKLFDNFLVIFGDFFRFLTIFGLFAGAQWDQSSIFRPTVHFLSFFDNFWRFFPFLVIFGDFWQFLTNKKGRALALKQELCLLFWLSGTCEKFAGQCGGALVHDFPNIEFFSSTSNLGLVQILLLNLGEHWCTTFPT